MRLSKLLFVIMIIILAGFSLRLWSAEGKVDVLDRDGDGNPDMWIHWDETGALQKIKTFYENQTSETAYLPPEKVEFNGKKLNKQKAVLDDKGVSIKQESYLYSEPFNLVYGEGFSEWGDGKGYYENNVLVRREMDSNRDGKTDYWEYCDKDGRPIKIESDLDFDGKVDEVKERGKDF